MPLIINRQSQVEQVEDTWTLCLDAEAALPAGDVIVPLKRMLADANGEISSHAGRVAPLVEPADDTLTIKDLVGILPLVAVHFPVFTDGRGFTHARILRERFGYQGEIRAVGDVTRDRLQYMARCGFDAFLIAEDRFKAEHLEALSEIGVDYQGGAYDPRPLFRRWAQ